MHLLVFFKKKVSRTNLFKNSLTTVFEKNVKLFVFVLILFVRHPIRLSRKVTLKLWLCFIRVLLQTLRVAQIVNKFISVSPNTYRDCISDSSISFFSRIFPGSQIIINLPFLISRYYYLCIYVRVNFAFKAMFLCSSGTRASFVLLAVSILAFGRKQRQLSGREKWISWTNLTWVLFSFFHSQLPPPPLPKPTQFLLLLWV